MNSKMLIAICAAMMLAGFGIGFPVGFALKQCPKCPELSNDYERIIDTVVLRQAVESAVPVVRPIPTKPKYVKQVEKTPEPGQEATIVGQDEQTVYYPEYRDTMPDTAMITVRFATEDPPEDILIDYVPPRQRVRLVERERTIRIPPPPPRRFGWLVGPYAGLGVGLDGRPVPTAGVAVSFGYYINR